MYEIKDKEQVVHIPVKTLEGVGQDAEIVTNKQGGKQSKSPMALHLVDPHFLKEWSITTDHNTPVPHYLFEAITDIADFMITGEHDYLDDAMVVLEFNDIQRLVRIAKVLQYGADRYEPNNWRLIPQESHINHALIHILAEILGDTQDDHIDHALCRLMMAICTSKSPNFSYTDYVSSDKNTVEANLEL